MKQATAGRLGILDDEHQEQREELLRLLAKAYWMEIETVMNYIACSVNPDGVRAQEVVEALEKDIEEELGHAREFARRIKELYGVVPGSEAFEAEQSFLQPPRDQIDIVHVVRGVIEAERGAIEHYERIVAARTRAISSPKTSCSGSCVTSRRTCGSSRAICASSRPMTCGGRQRRPERGRSGRVRAALRRA